MIGKFLTLMALISAVSTIYFYVLSREDLRSERESAISSGCAPIALSHRIENNAAVVEWKTAQECTGTLMYGSSTSVMTDIANPAILKPSTNHEIKIDGLQYNSTYYFFVVSDGKKYGYENLPVKFSTSFFTSLR